MNELNDTITFTVYEHISPSGKRYIGITSKSVKERWQSGGKGYCQNSHFWRAIVKYGWDNFEHNIVARDLSFDQACEMEISLIAKYDTTNPNLGYNILPGGQCNPTVSAEVRQQISRKLKQVCADPEYRANMSIRNLGHEVSASTRKKISEANKGNSNLGGSHNKGVKFTEAQKVNMYGHPSWCKGLTKYTDERVKRISELNTGRRFSQEQRDKMSQIQKRRFDNGFCLKWINDGTVERAIQKDAEVPEGFVLGRLKTLDTYIYKGTQSKKISHNDLDRYLADGWLKGRPKSVGMAIRASNQRMHWEYCGVRYESARELAEYLRQNGYPNIVDSTITSLYRTGFNNSKTYCSLDRLIRRVDHED